MPCKREVAPRRRCMDITSLDGVRGSVSYKKLSLETEGEETITGFGGDGADGFSHRAASKGKTTMSDKEKFEGFKQQMIEDNEKQYGAEIRETYGDAVVDASNAKMMGLTAEAYEATQALSQQINQSLKAAFEQGDPSSEAAQAVCALHQKWLGHFWNHYSKEAHLSLAQTYVDDPGSKSTMMTLQKGAPYF